nr:hypothetical protein [Tawny frogmouth aviadenovirus A]
MGNYGWGLPVCFRSHRWRVSGVWLIINRSGDVLNMEMGWLSWQYRFKGQVMCLGKYREALSGRAVSGFVGIGIMWVEK